MKKTGQWYLHLFSEKQPDLNWENPKLLEAAYAMMNRWFDRGVDGFRMDVISLIAKAPGLPDGQGDGYVFAPEQFAFQPKLHEYLREMRRRCFDGRDCMCVGETTFVTPENANSVVGDGRELDLLFQFDCMDLDGRDGKWNVIPFDLKKFKQLLVRWQEAIDWNTLFWGNHDQPRAVLRFGSDASEALRVRSAKMLAAAMYLLRGTPFLHQGEEIGMTNFPFQDETQLRDVESLNLLAQARKDGREAWAWNGIRKKGRDNARTPMQWDASANAGFTAGTPWIDVNPNYRQINVHRAQADPDSILHFYRRLLVLRQSSDALRSGTFRLLLPEHPQLLAYERACGEERIRVSEPLSTTLPIMPEQNAESEIESETLPRSEASAYIYPLEDANAEVLDSYDWQENPVVKQKSLHPGADFAADYGTNVLAVANGIVLDCSYDAAYGYILTLEHENGVQTQYAHLSEFLVNAGAEVRQGQIIAKTGDSGWTTGPHLHLGVLIDGEAVDPLEALKSES